MVPEAQCERSNRSPAGSQRAGTGGNLILLMSSENRVASEHVHAGVDLEKGHPCGALFPAGLKRGECLVPLIAG
jgi:hypothetical protein